MTTEEAEKLTGQVFLGKLSGYEPIYTLRCVGLSQNKKCIQIENVTIGNFEWRELRDVHFLDMAVNCR